MVREVVETGQQKGLIYKELNQLLLKALKEFIEVIWLEWVS